jgi:hypothetical protein
MDRSRPARKRSAGSPMIVLHAKGAGVSSKTKTTNEANANIKAFQVFFLNTGTEYGNGSFFDFEILVFNF